MVKCDLLHMYIILSWHFLDLVKVCLYLRQGLFISFGWDLFFISNFIFILITRLNVISIAPLHSVQPPLGLGRGVGILEFWVFGEVNFFLISGRGGGGCPMRGRELYFLGGGQFILRPFLILKSKFWKIHQFLPAAPSFSIFTFWASSKYWL